MAEKSEKSQSAGCPVGTFFREMENVCGRTSPFFKHMSRSRIEFLKGIRSLIDARIETLEKEAASKPEKKMTKIEVE